MSLTLNLRLNGRAYGEAVVVVSGNLLWSGDALLWSGDNLAW